MAQFTLDEIQDSLQRLQEKLRANFNFAPLPVACFTSQYRQVESTAQKAETTLSPAETIPQKLAYQDKLPAVTRENDLHTFIERVCKKLMAEQKRFPKARDVLNAIRNRTEEFDEDCIIVKILTDKIEWESMYGNIDTMKIASLANRISKIKPKLIKNNHR